MRDKEKVHDYRFMPEPNLLPLRLYDNSDIADVVDHTQIINIDAVKEQLPMLPMARREKLISQFNLPMIHANQIVVNIFEIFDLIFLSNLKFSQLHKIICTLCSILLIIYYL